MERRGLERGGQECDETGGRNLEATKTESGTVVYSAVHDRYGRIQQTGQDNTFDPLLKFSGKERDAVSQLVSLLPLRGGFSVLSSF